MAANDLPGRLVVDSARAAATKLRSLLFIGKRPTVRDHEGRVWDLTALETLGD